MERKRMKMDQWPRLSRLAIAMIALLFVTCSTGRGTTLIERVFREYGGSDAYRKTATFRMAGVVNANMRGMKGTMTRGFARPDRLRVEIDYHGGTGPEVRISDGERGWRHGEPVTGPLLTSMFLQAARTDLPWILFDRREALVELDEVEREGRTLRVLELALEDGMSLRVEIDAESARVMRSIGRAPVAGLPGGVMEFETRFGDFRRVDGVLIPFHEENIAMGQATGTTTVENVALAVDHPADTFRP